MVLASTVFFLVRFSWKATWSELASSGCWEASVVLASAVFFLVHCLTRKQAEQSLDFLRDLGALAVRARGMVCKTIQLGVPSLSGELNFGPCLLGHVTGQVFFLSR